MLFSRNILPSCSYCRFGSNIGDGEVACVKRGIVSAESFCRQYTYDPLKRRPDDQPRLNVSVLADTFPENLDTDPEAERAAERDAQLEAEINARLNEELKANLDSDLLE